ncbi:hypothetical protein ACRASX_08730 [Flavobacterium sp. TMP13]|uniref:hypothetical protein n=1 Tax=Flavobacterium sp. TMP13 TaxID=3425950 RepID=UPI003D76EA6E
MLDLETIEIKYKQIDLPIKLIKEKSIDDIVIVDDKLILMDNIVYPKYIFEFDIAISNSPEYLKTIELPMNGAYEHVVKGDGNKDWLIIFSSTFGSIGGSQHISIKGKKDVCLSVNDYFNSNNDLIYSIDPDTGVCIEKLGSYSFKDFFLVNDYLYVLRSDCLGYIDLNKTISMENFVRIPTDLTAIDKLIKTTDSRIVGYTNLGYELIG